MVANSGKWLAPDALPCMLDDQEPHSVVEEWRESGVRLAGLLWIISPSCGNLCGLKHHCQQHRLYGAIPYRFLGSWLQILNGSQDVLIQDAIFRADAKWALLLVACQLRCEFCQVDRCVLFNLAPSEQSSTGVVCLHCPCILHHFATTSIHFPPTVVAVAFTKRQ